MNNIFSKHIFSSEEIDSILELCGNFITEEETFERYGHRNIRKCKYGPVLDFEKIQEMIVSKLLNDGVESIDEDESNFVKYDKGDYFVEHQDISKSYRVDEPRAYTLVLQLSDESEYDGGTLIIEKQEQSKKKGTVIIFKSSLKHEVTEITNGSRIVFTNFLRKNNLTFLKENTII